ncbi:MAG: hypothetical protein LQ342_001240 [Letrouitia transgressa]|nr:MAG: hypothetical protein LQ342_001240 [Letrouitia transgressa]
MDIGDAHKKAESIASTVAPSRDLELQSIDLDLDFDFHVSNASQEKIHGENDPNLVELEGPDDPLNPQNIPTHKKWIYASLLGCMTLAVTFASSVFSTATTVTSKQFGVSVEVMTLGTSLYVFGFAAGPVLAGPASELYGRKIPLFTGYALFVIFQIPVGVARNLETIMLFRFLSGVASSGPPAIVGGYLADFFPPVERGVAVAVFAATTLVGPILGPIIGGFVTKSYLGWRWTAWITMLLASLCGCISIIVLPETYVPVLLKRKARRLRYETKNWALHSKLEETPVDIKGFASKYLSRPFLMLFLEPILLLLTLYLSFIYGIIYLLFEAYPVSFIEDRHYNEGVGALPFIAIIVGTIIGSAYVTYYTLTTIRSRYNTIGRVTPEDRLVPLIVGGAIFPVGLFWFAWTSFPSLSPWPQIVAGVPIGAGILIIFLQIMSYLIDVYTINANSALSANTMVRSLFGGGFPLFALPMYHNLGVQWATSLLGFLAVAFFPMPIIFYVYGEKIRRMSRYAPT